MSLDETAGKTNFLDNYASKVSTHSEKDTPQTGQLKKDRHQLRKTSGNLLPRERVSQCGQKPMSALITLHKDDGHSHFGGLETCGSVWHCPVCAAKITEKRREEIEELMKAHVAAGGFCFMATFTVPHTQFQSLKLLKETVADTWKNVKTGRKWMSLRSDCGWIGDIRALETTYGHNGWHPHIHVLLFFKAGTPEDDARELGEWLFEKWRDRVHKADLGWCSRSAFRFDKADNETGAADYVCKWGVSHELTKAHVKQSKGGRSPFQILRDYQRTGNQRDAKLFQEYGITFKGTRQLTWSRGLREMYLVTPLKSDEELSVDEQKASTHQASIHKDVFKLISKHKTAETLIAFETGGISSLLDFLTEQRIPWEVHHHQGLEQGRMVPLITLSGSQVKSQRHPQRPLVTVSEASELGLLGNRPLLHSNIQKDLEND